MKRIRDHIIVSIRRAVRDSRAAGIVIGLSGGIDSSVAAALCVKAVGRKNVLGLIMPCHSDPADAADARLLARHLGIRVRHVGLEKVFDLFLSILPEGKGLARSNIKPRLRMITLYYHANKHNYLVCGTGNKSELMVGYFTKYGDGAVDILPIADLYKRDVVALARLLAIPERIITKPPSAGLWKGQTDEGEMGITYAELDDILHRIDKGLAQVQRPAKVSLVKKMMLRSAHKRCMPQIFSPTKE